MRALSVSAAHRFLLSRALLQFRTHLHGLSKTPIDPIFCKSRWRCPTLTQGREGTVTGVAGFPTPGSRP